MNIFELTKIHKKRQQNRMSIYEDMLEICHKKIFNTSKGNLTSCVYKVPPFKFGYPLFNQNACIAFIILKLRRNGFDVYFEKPNRIHVSWEKHKQVDVFDDKILELEKNPRNTEQIMESLNYYEPEEQSHQTHISYHRPREYSNKPLYLEDKSESSSSSSNALQSNSYMTKYYKDLNMKYLVD